jgi:PQQ-like domain
VDAPRVPRLESLSGDSARVASLTVTPEDWPTYRANNAHSSSANVRLSNELGDLWTYQPPRAYKPTAATAAGSFIFLAGDDGKVRAIDTATGTLAWSYQTAGPIMQPPTIWNGRAYVGSGDGYVYALEATTGRLLWRFRAAPMERRIMIHGSLCSTWPVNSGVLVQDGVAYAAAGIVDYDGTYVYALDAATGGVKWQNIRSGHLDPELRKGVSAQGGLAIANGRLWMAGGNVISPASYDLNTGKYLGPEPGDGSPRANRGEEIGIFEGEYVISGGRLRYSARENVVNPGAFTIAQLATAPNAQLGMPLCWGRIPPAWNQDYVIAVNGRSTLPQSFRAADVAAYVKEGNEQRQPPSATLSGIPPNSDVIALVLADDRAVVVCTVVQPGMLAPAWRILLADLSRGSVTWQRNLPAAALPGGVLIDREGRVAVVLQNGGVVSFGGAKMIRAHVNAIRTLAKASATDKQEAIALLVGLLGKFHGPDVRGLVMDTLTDLGVEVGREAREAGCITRWHLIGPVPWDPRANPVNKIFFGEPDVDISEPTKLGSSTLTWREYNTELPHGTVELNRLYGIRADEAIYAYAEVNLSARQSRNVLLKVGSNDGFKCWFNGKEAGRFDGGRSYRPDQDTLAVRARPGINTVLLKVTQMGGGWGFSVRVTDTQNNPINLVGPAPRGQVHQTAAK